MPSFEANAKRLPRLCLRRLARSVNFAGRHGIVWIWDGAPACGMATTAAKLIHPLERPTMSDSLMHKHVAVAVIYDAATDKFLLWHNKRWRGYAFPMKQFDPQSGDACQAALDALSDWDMPPNLRNATASRLDRIVETLFSDGTHRVTVYEYHVCAVELRTGFSLASLPPDFRSFTYDELVAALNVTTSTVAIARALVGSRNVVLAVISRPSGRGREFLVVSNKLGQWFFPAARMKFDGRPEQAVGAALRADLGYDGPFRVTAQAEVPAVQTSTRFGAHQVQFHFFPCVVEFPEVDLTAPDNPLDAALKELPASRSAWFTETELRNRPDMSPTVAIVVNTVMQLLS
jgi:hypothetical protein